MLSVQVIIEEWESDRAIRLPRRGAADSRLGGRRPLVPKDDSQWCRPVSPPESVAGGAVGSLAREQGWAYVLGVSAGHCHFCRHYDL